MSAWKARVAKAAELYRAELRPVLDGRRFVLVGGPVAGLTGFGAELQSLGGSPFLVGTSLGTGPVPDRRKMPWFSFGLRARSMMEELHRSEAAMQCESGRLARALDRWDAERRARATGLIVMSRLPRVAGRRFWGGRLARWHALEDKTRIDGLWRSLGVARAPARVVAADLDALLRAHEALDHGAGTVWSADVRDGLNGGSEGVRRVRDRDDARRSARELARIADRVRVMPFLEGVPCSIHGIVLPGQTVVAKPVEMITLRRPDSGGFVYAGMSTTWDPPARDAAAMRMLCRRAGEAIRRRVGYRGPFTIDGILTADGFRPTEINARFGASMGLLASGATGVPMAWLCLAATAGERLRYRPRLLQEVLDEAADHRRAGRATQLVRLRPEQPQMIQLVQGTRGMRRARSGESPDGVLALGSSALGGFVRYVPDTRRIPRGERLAPRAIAAFAWADRRLGTGIGPLEAAPEAGC